MNYHWREDNLLLKYWKLLKIWILATKLAIIVIEPNFNMACLRISWRYGLMLMRWFLMLKISWSLYLNHMRKNLFPRSLHNSLWNMSKIMLMRGNIDLGEYVALHWENLIWNRRRSILGLIGLWFKIVACYKEST